jgi:polyvinyl alcohol dehydrogenase (cytochrome)
MIGYDAQDTRTNPYERTIKPSNVNRLVSKWVATITGDVSATPAVVDGAVYFGDFGGTFWKLDAASGATVWSHKVADYTGIAGDVARTSPSVDGNVVIVGSLMRPLVLGLDTTTGSLIWKTQVNPDTQATGHGIMTGSPVLVDDTVITGVSAAGASGPNATFRADIVALNALTGRILWQTYSLPDNGGLPGGYAGATMFAPPAVDPSAGLVYGTFGQPYTEPALVKACNASSPNGFSESCEQPGAYFDSIVAFNLTTGAPVWSYRVLGHAAWENACGAQPSVVTWCATEADNPLNGGDKWDLGGSGPNVFKIDGRDVVGVGEKSGLYILLDARTGRLVWNTLVGPGGDQGGFEWGTAYDGHRIYVSLTNQHHIQYRLTQNGTISSTIATGGSWAALDPRSGKILWQVADPQTESLPGFTNVGVWDLAPISSANGVVYASSMARTGNQMYALDGASGAILWRFAAGSSVNSGPAIADGSVYWGSGYARSGVEGSASNRLFAFNLPAHGKFGCGEHCTEDGT